MRGSSVGWIGARTGCFTWLRERITDVGFELYDFDSGSPDGLQRLIVATTDRINIGRHATSLRAFEEVPTAFATDSWWLGSGRTGLREFNQPLVPWFRWWESWHPWLHGESGQHFSALPNRHLHAIVANERSSKRELEHKNILLGRLAIVGHCASTISGWKEVAETVGWQVTWLSPTNLEPIPDCSNRRPPISSTDFANPQAYDLIIWDDSSLDTANREGHEAPESIKRIRTSFPDTTIVAACSLPHWNVWEKMQLAGANEILTKPETGMGLSRLLAAKAQVAQA